jgi:hypothetical protein
MFPAARTHQLTIKELPDETLVFDHENGKAHCLNRTASLVWKLCDGQTSLADLAERSGVPEVAVGLALEQLQRRRLLQGPVEGLAEEKRRSRRDVLKKLAAAAVALPVIMTISAPVAHAAVSGGCKTNADCASLNGNGGCIVGQCQNGNCVRVNAPSFVTACVGCPPDTICRCVGGTCVGT